jgi:hypothetical protein
MQYEPGCKDGLFYKYIYNFLKKKTEASGYQSNCQSNEEKVEQIILPIIFSEMEK